MGYWEGYREGQDKVADFEFTVSQRKKYLLNQIQIKKKKKLALTQRYKFLRK